MSLVVTIDGPAGAGKSTVARRLARALDYALLDTGAIYRSVALKAREQGVSWDDGVGLGIVAAALDIRFAFEGDVNHVYLGGLDSSEAIRTPDMSTGASKVSAHPEVRAALLDLQRRLGAHGAVVVEGRDTGTVVFPAARAKFFLTATAEERARRRYDELLAKGTEADLATTLAEILERDDRDSNREVAPLRPAEDAELVDSSTMALDEVVAHLVERVRARLAAA